MGYSNNKWRKILTILMIINLCFILFARFTRVFGATSNFYVNVTNINKYQFLVSLGSSQYGGIRNFKLPQFIYDYKNIILTYSISKSNTSTKRAYLIISNNDIYFKNGDFAGDGTTTSRYYTYSISGLSNSTIDISNIQLSDMRINAGNGNYFLGGIYNNTSDYLDYSYMGLLGSLYDYTTRDIITENLPFISPFFDNLTEIENGYPDGVFISRGDYSENEPLYFHLLKITNAVPDGNQSTYYYESKIFKLTKNSKYYKTYDSDTDNDYSYYYVSRSALSLDTNSSYLYVLSNSGDSISNSYGILQSDISAGVYDVVESDTAGVITEQQALNDKIQNMNNNINDYHQQQQEFQNQNTILPETNTDISNNLQFNNSNPQFDNIFNNYFSTLTSIVSDLGDYEDSSVMTINLPVPHTNSTIPIQSDIFSSHIPTDIYFIIQMFWYFIFGKYYLNFVLKIYYLFATGQILERYSLNGEVITQDML